MPRVVGSDSTTHSNIPTNKYSMSTLIPVQEPTIHWRTNPGRSPKLQVLTCILACLITFSPLTETDRDLAYIRLSISQISHSPSPSKSPPKAHVVTKFSNSQVTWLTKVTNDRIVIYLNICRCKPWTVKTHLATRILLYVAHVVFTKGKIVCEKARR